MGAPLDAKAARDLWDKIKAETKGDPVDIAALLNDPVRKNALLKRLTQHGIVATDLAKLQSFVEGQNRTAIEIENYVTTLSSRG